MLYRQARSDVYGLDKNTEILDVFERRPPALVIAVYKWAVKVSRLATISVVQTEEGGTVGQVEQNQQARVHFRFPAESVALFFFFLTSARRIGF